MTKWTSVEMSRNEQRVKRGKTSTLGWNLGRSFVDRWHSSQLSAPPSPWKAYIRCSCRNSTSAVLLWRTQWNELTGNQLSVTWQRSTQRTVATTTKLINNRSVTHSQQQRSILPSHGAQNTPHTHHTNVYQTAASLNALTYHKHM